ncbi:uncharacterized protein LOC143916295 isoform X1 [Arctopsyche grandis]|uniref:uncharacterized protein LOC143916295 isoform X1 n=1 Tax=Arctopsyche grandis TaxID=121162 RepID=UPI00406DA0BA
MADPLEIVDPSRWPSLMSMFAEPSGLTARATLKTQILNVEKDPGHPANLYAPFGDPNNGIVFVWMTSPINVEIALFCMNDDKTKLMDAVMKTKRIDRSKNNIYCSVMPEIYPHLGKALKTIGCDAKIDETVVTTISIEKAKNFDIPNRPNVRVETIGPEYANEIDELWPHRYPGSIMYFQNMLTRGFAIGLIDEVCNEIIGWIFTSIRGDLHVLQVKDKYKRKGYGQMLVKLMSKKVAERGIEVFATIIMNNSASKEMFAKCGFEFLWVVKWLLTGSDYLDFVEK